MTFYLSLSSGETEASLNKCEDIVNIARLADHIQLGKKCQTDRYTENRKMIAPAKKLLTQVKNGIYVQ